MKKIMKRTIALGTIMVMVLVSCLPTFASGFSVYDDNGYTGLVTEFNFESLNVGESTNVNWLFSSSIMISNDPAQDGTHGKVAFMPNASNICQFNNTVFNPWHNTNNGATKTNPGQTLRNKLALSKLEVDLYCTSDQQKVGIYMADADYAKVQGQGGTYRFHLLDFDSGKIKLRNAPADAPEISVAAKTWYHFTFYVDCVNGTYTCYRDNELLGEDLWIYENGAATGIAPQNFGVEVLKTNDLSATEDGVYFDNLKCSVVPLNTRKFEIGKEVLANDFDGYEFDSMPVPNFAPVGFGTNNGSNGKRADIQLAEATVDAAKHQNVARVYARTVSDETTSAALHGSIFRSIYTTVHPENKNTIQLEGEELEKAKKLVASMDIMLSDYCRGSIEYVEAGGGVRSLVTFRKAGYMEIKSRATSKTATEDVKKIGYEPNKWYSFRIYLDFDADADQADGYCEGYKGTYTMCINGQNVMENEPLPSDAVGYLTAFGWSFSTASSETAQDTYVDIDNYSLHQVNCVTTPKLNRIRQKAGEYKLTCLPGREVDMLLGRYDSTEGILQEVQSSRGQAGTYHMLKVQENADYKDRVYWWKLDSLLPVAGLPELTD